jgi:hypothetical protein
MGYQNPKVSDSDYILTHNLPKQTLKDGIAVFNFLIMYSYPPLMALLLIIAP